MKFLLLMVCTVGVVFAGGRMTLAAETANATSGAAVPQAVLDPLIGETERHFDQASSLFTRGDNQGAASEIHSAAAMVRLEASRQGTGNNTELMSSASQLDQLASEVERGDVASRSQLNSAFARADLALAAHYRSLADSAIAAKQHDNAGIFLKAASDYLENASLWTGQPPPTLQSEAQDQTRALEVKIRRGANWSYDEAKKGVGYLGTQIQALGTQMQNVGNSSNTASHSP